jgi:flagellar biogenesis protein FliO
MTTETLSRFPNSWFTNRCLTNPWWLRTRSFWLRVARWGARTPRSLRLRESLPLGEHRFVAVIEFEDSRLLIGGTPSSLVLLARLGSGPAGAPEADPSAFAEANPGQVPIEEFQTVRETEKRKQKTF